MIRIYDKETGQEVWRSHAQTLQGVDLSRARLRYAALNGQNLMLADLNKTNLWGADLRGADLRGADLREANLCRADFEGARLEGANLDGALYDDLTRWPEGFDLSWQALKHVDPTKL